MSKTKARDTDIDIQPEVLFNQYRRAEESHDHRAAAQALDELERLGYRITRVKTK